MSSWLIEGTCREADDDGEQEYCNIIALRV